MKDTQWEDTMPDGRWVPSMLEVNEQYRLQWQRVRDSGRVDKQEKRGSELDWVLILCCLACLSVGALIGALSVWRH